MINFLIEKFSLLFDNLAIPVDVVSFFGEMLNIWDSIPYAVRFVFIGCFSVACMFVILKMLF